MIALFPLYSFFALLLMLQPTAIGGPSLSEQAISRILEPGVTYAVITDDFSKEGKTTISSVTTEGALANYYWDISKPITVENHLGERWSDGIAYSVRQWQLAFPRLKLKYATGAKGKCEFKDRTVLICEQSSLNEDSGNTWSKKKGHEVLSVKISIRSYPNRGPWHPEDPDSISLWDLTTIGHELGHAWGLNHTAHPATSIMSTSSLLIAPGPMDITNLRKLYDGKSTKAKNDRQKKKKNGKAGKGSRK